MSIEPPQQSRRRAPRGTAALTSAGMTGVVAKVRTNAGNLAVSFESVNAGAGETLSVTGAAPLFSGAPTTINGAGPGATPVRCRDAFRSS